MQLAQVVASLGVPQHKPCLCCSANSSPLRPALVRSQTTQISQRRFVQRTGSIVSGCVWCKQQSGSNGLQSKSQAQAQRLAKQLPTSKEQSIEQGAQALKHQLEAAVSKTKGFKSKGTKKLAIDIPVADDSTKAISELVAGLAQGLPQASKDQLTIIFADDNTAQKAVKALHSTTQNLRAMSLGDAFLENLSGVLLVVGAKQDQIEKVEVLLSEWKGRAAILLNVEWDFNNIPAQHRAFASSFDSIYSFLPLEIKGFIFKTPAVIYKNVAKGTPAGSPWYVFIKEGNSHKCIAQQQQRLTPENLELAFYNYKAAESPLTKGVKMFKSILPQK